MKNQIGKVVVVTASLWVLSGCAYFNTYYNAERFYKDGIAASKTSKEQAGESFKKAQEKAAIVLAKWPTSRWAVDAFHIIAMTYFRLGDYNQTVRRCDDFLTLFPRSGHADEIAFTKGRALVELKEYTKALVVFQDLVNGSKSYRERASFEIGRTYRTARDYGAAVKTFQAFIDRFPRSRQRSEAALGIAESHYELKEYGPARFWFADYLKKAYTSKDKTRVTLKLATCLFLLDEFTESQRVLKSIVGLYPEFEAELHLLMGKCQLGGRDTTAAIASLSKVGSGPSGAEAYYLIGRVYEEGKDYQKAQVYYDSTRQKAPNSDYTVLALERKSLLALVSGDTTVSKDPAESQFHLAEVYLLNLNQPEKALAEYEKVSANYPKSPFAAKALFARGWVLEHTVKKDGYIEVYREVVMKYPGTEYARRAADILKKHEIPDSTDRNSTARTKNNGR